MSIEIVKRQICLMPKKAGDFNGQLSVFEKSLNVHAQVMEQTHTYLCGSDG